jgi:hypothetical protein
MYNSKQTFEFQAEGRKCAERLKKKDVDAR